MNKVLKSVVASITLIFVLTSQSAAEGLPDILGIQLGMPVRDAHAKLQTALPKYKIQVQSTNLPTIEKPVIYSFSSAPAETIMSGMEADQVIVDVTLPPNKQAVWRVYRTHYFPGNGIPKATLLASLREKYGKETRAMNTGLQTTTDDKQIAALLWLLDEQGRPAALPPLHDGVVDPITSCPRRADAQHVVESPLPNYGNKDLAWCLSAYTAVNVEFQQNSAMPELCTQMYVMVVSLPIGRRAGEATMKWKQDIAEGKYKQEIENAKQQEKPKL
jgi:hypothetical protein